MLPSSKAVSANTYNHPIKKTFTLNMTALIKPLTPLSGMPIPLPTIPSVTLRFQKK